MPNNDRSAIDTEEFVRLLMANERRIFAYLLTLLPNLSDAEDVLQETSVVLWRKFPEYRSDASFTAWAFSVARNVARNHRAKLHRCRVKFDDQLLDIVADDAAAVCEKLDHDRAALLDCVEELTPSDRELLKKRYEPGATIRSVAAAVGRPIEGMYKAMRRIHDALFDCVHRKLTVEGIHVRKP
jgi:RNA polymerase sigma-70 factor (ECF subfamily)